MARVELLVDKWAVTLALVGARDARFALPAALIEKMQKYVTDERDKFDAALAINKRRWRIMDAHPWAVKINEDAPLWSPVYSLTVFNLSWFQSSFPDAVMARAYGPGFYGMDQVRNSGMFGHNSMPLLGQGNWLAYVEALCGGPGAVNLSIYDTWPLVW